MSEFTFVNTKLGHEMWIITFISTIDTSMKSIELINKVEYQSYVHLNFMM